MLFFIIIIFRDALFLIMRMCEVHACACGCPSPEVLDFLELEGPGTELGPLEEQPGS